MIQEASKRKLAFYVFARQTLVGQALTAFIRQPPLDPLLEKEGKPINPLYQEGWILSRLFGTKDGVCQEYWYNSLIVLTAGIYR